MADINTEIDNMYADLGIPRPPRPGILDTIKESLPVKAARSFFEASQGIGGTVAGSVLGDDVYDKALQEKLDANPNIDTSSSLDTTQLLPGAGDVGVAAIPDDIRKSMLFKAIGDPVLRMAGNIAGDPTNLLGIGAGVKAASGAKALAAAIEAGEIPKILQTASAVGKTNTVLKPVMGATSTLGHIGAAAFAPDIIQGVSGGISAAKQGYDSGDVGQALGGATQTALSAGLAALVAKGMLQPHEAYKIQLQEQADKGVPSAIDATEQIRQHEAAQAIPKAGVPQGTETAQGQPPVAGPTPGAPLPGEAQAPVPASVNAPEAPVAPEMAPQAGERPEVAPIAPAPQVAEPQQVTAPVPAAPESSAVLPPEEAVPTPMEDQFAQVQAATPGISLDQLGNLAPEQPKPALPPAPEGTIAPKAQETFDKIANDPIKSDLYGKFAGLRETVAQSFKNAADKKTLDKYLSDAYDISVGNFEPSDEALAKYNAGDKSQLYSEFRKYATGNMRTQAKNAFKTKAAANTEIPETLQPVAATAAEETSAPTLQQSLETGKQAKLEATAKAAIKPENTTDQNANAILEALAKNHPDEIQANLKNPGKGGDATGTGFQNKAWQYWALRQASPELQDQEIAKLLGVNKTQISKYKKAIEQSLGSEKGVGSEIADVAKNIKFQGDLRPANGGINWKLGEKSAKLIPSNGDLTFQVEGKLPLEAAMDGIGVILKAPDQFTGRINLADLGKSDLESLLKAKFISPLEREWFKVEKPTIQKLSGGLGFIPSGKLGAIISDLGEQGVAIAKKGLEYIKRGLTDGPAWAAQMVKEFGQAVAAHARNLFNELSKAARSFSFGPLEKEPQGEILGSLGGGLQKFLERKPIARSEILQNAELAGQKAAKAPEIVEPGKPGGGTVLTEEGKKVTAADIAFNSKTMGLSKAADAVAVEQMKVLDPLLSRSMPETEKSWLHKSTLLIGNADPDTVASIAAKAKSLKPEEVLAIRRIAKDAWEKSAEAKNNLQNAILSGDEDKIMEAQMNSLKATAEALYKGGKLSGETGTALGRLLRAYGVLLPKTPEELKAANFLKALEDAGVKKGYAQTLQKLWDARDMERFNNGLRIALEPSMGDKALEVWRAGLLGPGSLIAKSGSDMGLWMAREGETRLAAALDKARVAVFGGQRELYSTPGDIAYGAYQAAIAEAMPKFRADLSSIVKGEPLPIIDRNRARRLNEWAGAVGGKLGEYLRNNFKAMDAITDVAQTMSLSRANSTLAWSEAMRESGGNKIRAREAFPKFYDELNRFTADPKTNPTPEVWDLQRLTSKGKRALEMMKQDTFTEDLKGAIRSMSRAIGDSTLLTIVAPFRQTPVNIAKQAFARTPLGIISLTRKIGAAMEGMEKDIPWTKRVNLAVDKVGKEEIEQDVSKMIGGTVGAWLLMNTFGGHIMGGGPTDPKKRSQLQLTGWLPYSIKAGDQYIAYNRLEPLSSVLGMAADIKEGIQYGEFDKASKGAQRLVATVTENLTNKTFLSGLEGLFTMWSDPAQYAERWVKEMQGSAVPNTIAGVPFGILARSLDPTFRQTDAFTAGPFLAKIPGLSQTLPEQLGPAGEPRERLGTFPERLISPIQRQEVKTGVIPTVAAEADRIDYTMAPPKRFQDYGSHKVEYTPEEMKTFQEAHQAAIQRMNSIMKDPTYQRLPDNESDPKWNYGAKTKQEVMESVFSQFRRQALTKIKPQALARGKKQFGDAAA